MWRKLLEFSVTRLVRAGRSDDQDLRLRRGCGQAAQVLNDLLRPWDVELALRLNEIELRIYVPEQQFRGIEMVGIGHNVSCCGTAALVIRCRTLRSSFSKVELKRTE